MNNYLEKEIKLINELAHFWHIIFCLAQTTIVVIKSITFYTVEQGAQHIYQHSSNPERPNTKNQICVVIVLK